MTFTVQNHISNHLVETVTSALIAEVQATCKQKNIQVDHHKAEGIRWPYFSTGRYIIESQKRLEEKSTVFGWDEPRYYPHYANIVDEAHAQALSTISLLEQRIGQHMTDQEYIYKTDLKINYSNQLIEGRVYGCTYEYGNVAGLPAGATVQEKKEATKFEIYVRMIWNYRYGENSANGHLTQYTQFRSERHGTEMIGKSKVQRATDEEKAKKAAEKQAAADAKILAKWDRFLKLPVQMEKWLTKEIHDWAGMITSEGLTKAKEQCAAMDCKFDQDWYINRSKTNIEKLAAMRTDCRKWQNNKNELKRLFDEGVDTRQKLKDLYGVW